MEIDTFDYFPIEAKEMEAQKNEEEGKRWKDQFGIYFHLIQLILAVKMERIEFYVTIDFPSFYLIFLYGS